jgi:hypothetical protein
MFRSRIDRSEGRGSKNFGNVLYKGKLMKKLLVSSVASIAFLATPILADTAPAPQMELAVVRADSNHTSIPPGVWVIIFGLVALGLVSGGGSNMIPMPR